MPIIVSSETLWNDTKFKKANSKDLENTTGETDFINLLTKNQMTQGLERKNHIRIKVGPALQTSILLVVKWTQPSPRKQKNSYVNDIWNS